MNEVRQAIERFIKTSKRPFLCEPGEESLALTGDNFILEPRNGSISFQAWDNRRNLVRRIVGVESEQRGRLTLRIERFAKRTGLLSIVDLSRPANRDIPLRGARQEFRETFRRFLRRQFPGHKIVELSTEANLQESLSPTYPRALLRQGSSAWAAIAAPAEASHSDGVLSFGLIWLDHLRRREPNLVVHGLILYLPNGHERTTCLRLRYLNQQVARYAAFAYSEDGFESEIDLRDYGNLDTRLDPCQRRLPSAIDDEIQRLKDIPGVETIQRNDGELSVRVRGVEFARTLRDRLLLGVETKHVTSASNATEAELYGRELARLRCAGAPDRLNPLYLRNRELWLESQVRAGLEEIDARLAPSYLYGQVPAFAATDRGIIDLLGVDTGGRLAVIELKASEDIHLPLQALDYWMRVKWHAERREFAVNGYFPGIELRSDNPRMLLVSPALDLHPTNECVMRYFSPAVEWERIGVGIEWQKKLKVMFKAKRLCQ